jgi:hypothetical protein
MRNTADILDLDQTAATSNKVTMSNKEDSTIDRTNKCFTKNSQLRKTFKIKLSINKLIVSQSFLSHFDLAKKLSAEKAKRTETIAQTNVINFILGARDGILSEAYQSIH